MSSTARLAALVDRAVGTGDRMLVVYATLGDPATDDELLLAAAAAGADVLEVGLVTASARPRGAEIAESFARARQASAGDPIERCARLRALAPATAIMPLVYPETIGDLGIDSLLDGAAGAGMDGLVVVGPTGPDQLAQVEACGLPAVPVLRSDDDAARIAALERAVSLLTYRTLAPTTGASLDLSAACAAAAAAARTALRPFLVGFGVSHTAEVRALATHAAGVVIGSALIRLARAAPPDEQAARVAEAVTAWRTAAGAGRDNLSDGREP